MQQLKDILSKLELYSKTNSDKGRFFEIFVQKYLQTSAVYKNRFSDVFLWLDFPHRNCIGDTGIDIVAIERGTGNFVAIQCKFYNENTTIDKKDIDTFISTTNKHFLVDNVQKAFSSGMVLATTDKISKNAEDTISNQKIPIKKLSIYELLQDESIDFSSLYIDKPTEIKQNTSKKTLREHQINALNDVLEGFKTNDRGKLIMACGTGKTFTSLKIAEAQAGAGKIVLFLVPSISLMSQTIREWLNESAVTVDIHPVCSDVSVAKSEDDVLDFSLNDLEFPASTDELHFVKRFQCFKNNNMQVIFSTYHSLDVVHRAQKILGFEFDLIICDEAHRTTGVKLSDKDESSFTKVHKNDFIKAKKRLYMTATPRVYGEGVKSRAEDANIELCSMDDEDLYGKEFHRLGFGEAVEKGLLADYKVQVLVISEGYVKKEFQEQFVGEDNEINIEDVAKLVGCWNGLSKRYGDIKDLAGDELFDSLPMKRAVAFTSTIKDSKKIQGRFTNLQNNKKDKTLIDIEIDHVDGKMSR